MRVLLFGATGMVGQGVLRECLRDPEVEQVVAVVRSSTGRSDPKLTELIVPEVAELERHAGALAGFDACLFCLGVSSFGMSEADYRRVTYDLTLTVAQVVLRESPGVVFLYVSGAGTDSSARGRVMWARVKGEAENALLAMPFRGVYMFRPAFIQPRDGITSKTPLYRGVYAVLGPLTPALRAVLPGQVTTTDTVGRAMLVVAKRGASQRILENREINALGALPAG